MVEEVKTETDPSVEEPLVKEESTVEAVDEKKGKKKRKSKTKRVFAKAKKKTASARARIKKGKGRITINKLHINLVKPRYLLEYLREPLELLDNSILSEIDIDVDVRGGGVMGQAVAARSAIAKVIVEYTNDKKIKDAYMDYDRMLLVDDFRRKEPKKPLGRGARKKRQLSFR